MDLAKLRLNNLPQYTRRSVAIVLAFLGIGAFTGTDKADITSPEATLTGAEVKAAVERLPEVVTPESDPIKAAQVEAAQVEAAQAEATVEVASEAPAPASETETPTAETTTAETSNVIDETTAELPAELTAEITDTPAVAAESSLETEADTALTELAGTGEEPTMDAPAAPAPEPPVPEASAAATELNGAAAELNGAATELTDSAPELTEAAAELADAETELKDTTTEATAAAAEQQTEAVTEQIDAATAEATAEIDTATATIDAETAIADGATEELANVGTEVPNPTTAAPVVAAEVVPEVVDATTSPKEVPAKSLTPPPVIEKVLEEVEVASTEVASELAIVSEATEESAPAIPTTPSVTEPTVVAPESAAEPAKAQTPVTTETTKAVVGAVAAAAALTSKDAATGEANSAATNIQEVQEVPDVKAKMPEAQTEPQKEIVIPQSTPVVGTEAPATKAKTETTPAAVTDLVGNYPDKLLMVVFWSIASEDESQSFDWLNEMHQRYANRGLQVIAVNQDTTARKGEAYAVKRGAKFEVTHDRSGALRKALWVGKLPATYLLNDAGELLGSHAGFNDDIRGSYEDEIRRLLKTLR